MRTRGSTVLTLACGCKVKKEFDVYDDIDTDEPVKCDRHGSQRIVSLGRRYW
jgi:hypothetical protein